MSDPTPTPPTLPTPPGVAVEDSSGSDWVTAEHLGILGRLTAHLYRRLHLAGQVELSVTLIDDAQMEQLHREWMDLPDTTDVMSFPMDELVPGTADAPVDEGVLGDIVLSPEVARRQAEAAGHAPEDELALLCVHGVLHLLGHDHADPDDRREMFSLQRTLLEEFLGRPSPAPTEA